MQSRSLLEKSVLWVGRAFYWSLTIMNLFHLVVGPGESLVDDEKSKVDIGVRSDFANIRGSAKRRCG